MPRISRGLAVGLILMCLFAPSCDDRDSGRAQQALDEQLRQQAIQQRKADQAAREAKESRDFWIAVLSAGGCVSSLLLLLLGVYIGSSAIRRYRKDFHGPHQ